MSITIRILMKKINIYEHNYQNFNEKEFNETLFNMNWDRILLISESDPNTSMNNIHQHINYLLDELAPYKKTLKKRIQT